MSVLWIFSDYRRVALIAAATMWSSAGLYPIYDLCPLMYLPRYLPRLEPLARSRRLTSCADILMAARVTRAA